MVTEPCSFLVNTKKTENKKQVAHPHAAVSLTGEEKISTNAWIKDTMQKCQFEKKFRKLLSFANRLLP
jgi:hypothetical protein